MKYFVLIISLFLGISLTSSASFFNGVSYGISSEKNILQINKGFTQKPLFVWSKGQYHPITTPASPFYDNNIFEINLAIRKILKPNELGTLWMITFAKGTNLIKDNDVLSPYYRLKSISSEGLRLQQDIKWNSLEQIKKNNHRNLGGLLER
ncbi:MAG TPA: hypothetical protein PKX92_04155 [Edaphocola sp.]|nr:hypothetical protein [Edaphocola sp.]